MIFLEYNFVNKIKYIVIAIGLKNKAENILTDKISDVDRNPAGGSTEM
jgi:hypothetical protein